MKTFFYIVAAALTAGAAAAFELAGPKGAATVVVPELAETPRLFEGEHEIPLDEWHSFCLSCKEGEAVVDDIVVEPLP